MIPIEHQLLCPGCGKILDMRDVNCIAHGWIEDGLIVCYDDTGIPYSSSKQVGEPIEWTREKKPIALN